MRGWRRSEKRRLFVPQRFHGIYGCGAARRDQASQTGNRNQQDGDSSEDQRIA
jgi:hypothetical protein